MKKILILVFVLLSTIVKSQDVTPFVGVSTNRSILFGVEFKTETWGGYVERYVCKKDYQDYQDIIDYRINNLKIISNFEHPTSNKKMHYDGLMIGVNRHFKSLSNVLLSFGIGYLNEFELYNYSIAYLKLSKKQDEIGTVKKVNQKFAFEFSGGQDFEINNHLIMGLKGGFNTRTEIFGTASIGYRF
jgi:hypothetical protein